MNLTDFYVRIDLEDPKLVWFDLPDLGMRFDVLWAPGFSVKAGTPSVVIGPSGKAVFHEDEFVQGFGVCATANQQTFVVRDESPDAAT